MTNGLSVPPCSSFPTSFATETERLNCLIYASELCMNPSEAADLQMTQAGWHHCSSAARNKAERRNAGGKIIHDLGKNKIHDGPQNLTPVFVFLFFEGVFLSWSPSTAQCALWGCSLLFTHSDRKMPHSHTDKWSTPIALIYVFIKYFTDSKKKKKKVCRLSNVI